MNTQTMNLFLFFGIIAIVVIAGVWIQATRTTTPAPKTGSKKSWSWLWKVAIIVLIIFGVIKLYPYIFYGWNKKTPKSETSNNTVATQSNKELLEPMGEGYVSPNTPWETEKIDYKYKFRTDGHSFNLQFSKRGGGWTKPIPIPKEGDYNPPLPDDAIQGPMLVTAGPYETEPFRVQLYKRI